MSVKLNMTGFSPDLKNRWNTVLQFCCHGLETGLVWYKLLEMYKHFAIWPISVLKAKNFLGRSGRLRCQPSLPTSWTTVTRVHDGTVEIIARDVEEMCYGIKLSGKESIDWNSVHLEWNGSKKSEKSLGFNTWRGNEHSGLENCCGTVLIGWLGLSGIYHNSWLGWSMMGFNGWQILP